MEIVGVVGAATRARAANRHLQHASDDLAEKDRLTTVESDLGQSTIVTDLARDIGPEQQPSRSRQYQRADRVRRAVQRHVGLERGLRDEVVHAAVERAENDRARYERGTDLEIAGALSVDT